MIISAKRQTNQREKDKTIRESIALCKDVAAKLNLDVLVSFYMASSLDQINLTKFWLDYDQKSLHLQTLTLELN